MTAAPKAKPKKPRTNGRPTKFTEDNRNLILRFVREGNAIKHAAAAARCNPRTVELWRAKGEEGDPKFVQFYEDFKFAEALAITEAVRQIRASKDDRTKMWFLARKCPEEWGDKIQVEFEKRLGDAVERVLDVVEELLGPEHAAKIVKRLKE